MHDRFNNAQFDNAGIFTFSIVEICFVEGVEEHLQIESSWYAIYRSVSVRLPACHLYRV